MDILPESYVFYFYFFVQLQSGPPLDEISIGCILRDLLHAVEYLHNEGKIHRDIKGSLLLFIRFFFFIASVESLKL